VELEALPRPEGVELAEWTCVFPTYAFLLTTPEADVDAVSSEFRGRKLACERIGTIDDTGRFRVRLGGEEAQLLDLNTEPVTGLRRS
jgi:selenophosphate synthetase-related protein